MRVLLAGMKIPQNQFTRALTKYGCEVVHTDPDPGKFPTNCDAAVIAKCQISHQKFWDVVECYNDQEKKVFYAVNGFSEIKKEFEVYMNQQNVVVRKAGSQDIIRPQQPTKRPPEPFNQPKIVDETEEVSAAVSLRKVSPKSDEGRERTVKIRKIIKECLEAGMSNNEIADMLHAEGLYKHNGERFAANDVAAQKTTMRKLEILPERWGSEEGEKAPTPVVAAPTVRLSPTEQCRLITRITTSNLPDEEKLKRIRMVQEGLLTSEVVFEAKVVNSNFGPKLQIMRSDFARPGDELILSLTKDQAVAVKQTISEIEKFLAN